MMIGDADGSTHRGGEAVNVLLVLVEVEPAANREVVPPQTFKDTKSD